MLRRIKETGDIYVAWSDEPWILDGAAVRISIVSFDDGTECQRTLNGVSVATINSDLTAETDITHAQKLVENQGIAFIGGMKKGPFDIPGDLARQMIGLPLNPNGRPNIDVIRPYANALEIVRRPQDIWIIDFGVGTTEEMAALYEAPFEYVREHVYPLRVGHREAIQASRWWLLARPAYDLRKAIEGLTRFIMTPRVSKHRLFAWADPITYAEGAVVVFAREDEYFLGVLHSRAHEVWSLRMGTWLGKGNDPRYTPTTCFETFPLPWPPGQEPVDDSRVIAIGDTAKKLDELRNNWLNPEGASDADLKKRTLTNLYNAKPTWLQNVHAALDRAVWIAYGWPTDEVPAVVEEDVILSRLLELNQEQAAKK